MAKVLVVDDFAEAHDILEVVTVTDDTVRARAPFRFEIGEEVHLRIGDPARDVTAKVKDHDADHVTEFAIVA